MKVRDLQKSHDVREAIKQRGGDGSQRRRVFVATPSTCGVINANTPPPPAPAPVLLSASLKPTEKRNDNSNTNNNSNGDNTNNRNTGNNDNNKKPIDQEIADLKTQREELRAWVNEKKALRNGLNSLCLTERVLKNKPEKTICESRVLTAILRKKANLKVSKRTTGGEVVVESPKISSAHLDVLPHLDTPLPIALAIIADHLQEKRMRLVDLFTLSDRNKDWLTTRDELRHALKGSGVPLTDLQINELVFALDVNLDNQLSYKELAQGIDAYRKDKRWQKLKEIFDVLVEKGDIEERELADSFNERKNAMDLLRLPQNENNTQNAELRESLTINEKRQRQLAERQHKRKVKIKGGIKSEYLTTLEGSHGDSKIQYLQFIDQECKRCIEQIHLQHLPTKSEKLVSILIPPAENPRPLCQSGMSSTRSAFPYNHSNNRRYRLHQEGKLRSQGGSSYNATSVVTSPVSSSSHLPRVATLDFKDRAKDGKQRREQLRRTSPTACWPQHLLDKLRIYMDSDDGGDGKQVLFAQIRQ